MKKGLVIVVVFSMFLSSLVLADVQTGSTCSSGTALFRLSNYTNAHAEMLNPVWGPQYNSFVSCLSYNVNIDPTCTLGDVVLKLFNETNSHAQTGDQSGYPYLTCFENMQCDYVGASDCSSLGAEYECVASLSNWTNAHVAQCTGSVAYDIKACCKLGFTFTGASWENMRGNLITHANSFDTARLVARGTAFDGQEINFTVYKSVPFWFDKVTAQGSGLAYTTWQASEDGTYWFRARNDIFGEEQDSGNLVVTVGEDNAPPVAKIETPKIGEIHFLNQPISFTQSSYDEDDELLTEWNFGDGVTNNSYNTTHPYSTTGQKNIKLTVTEALRGGEDSDVTSVLAISSPGKYVFAHIHEPAFWAVFQGQIVYFNASKSYAVEYNASGVFCLAGPCPNQTAGGTNLIDCDLSPCPNGKCSCGLAPMNFSWTFYDGQGNYETSCCSDNNQPASEFELTFGKSGWHRAVLTVGINPTSTIETTFGTEMEEVNTGNGSLSKNKLDKDVLKDLLKVVLVLVVVFVIYYLLKKRSKKKFRQVKVKKKR